MKKHLFSLSLFLLAASFSIAQNKLNNFSTRNAVEFGSNQVIYKSRTAQSVPTTTTTSCMSVNLPTPATWTITNYGSGTGVFAENGLVNGANSDGDKEKAMYFDLSAASNTLITQVYVGFGIAYSATPSKTVAVKIYEGTTGTVGAALGTATITMGEIMSDVVANRYSLVIFPTPIATTSKKFFASVDVSGLQWTAGVKDSLSIYSNTSPQTNPTNVWEKWSDNTWHKYTTAGSWNLNISLLIHPFLTQVPLIATFSTSSNTICAGQSVSYNSAGSTAGTYTWDFGAIATPTATGATVAATYSAAGTYTTFMLVADACGSLDAAQTFITVKPKPVISATPPSTVICNGTALSLSGSGASTYTWTGGISNGVSFTPPASAGYTLTATGANGCTNTAVSNITVNNLPNVTASPASTVVCSGSSITLNGGGATTYTWTGGITNGNSFTPSLNSYTVSGTDANGCVNKAVSSLTINTLPNVTASPVSTVVCSGSSITLNGGGATTYTWTGGVTNGTSFAPSLTGYTVSGTDANGCVNKAVSSITINSLPNVTANPASTVVCNGSSITLNGGGATTYTWTGGVTNGASFAPSLTGYTVSGTDANGCVNTAVASVTLNALPNVSANTTASVICVGENVTLTGSGATTYTWTSGVLDGVAFMPTSTDVYTVTGSDNGCVSTATIEVQVATCTGISVLSALKETVLIYPNPNNGEFTIKGAKAETIVITNELGQIFQTIELNQANDFTYKIGNLSAGIYFLNGKSTKQKIVVTR